MLITNFAEFANEKTMYDFFISPLLTLFYLPFIFAMTMFIVYESVFKRLPIAIKDPAVLRYARIYAACKFHFRIKSLERWTRLLILEGVSGDVISKMRIKESINALFEIMAVERNPPVIPGEEGWSPYVAKKFLANEGLTTGAYDPINLNSTDEWFAMSPFVNFGDGLLQNQIFYSIKGNATTVKAIELRLTVYSRERLNLLI